MTEEERKAKEAERQKAMLDEMNAMDSMYDQPELADPGAAMQPETPVEEPPAEQPVEPPVEMSPEELPPEEPTPLPVEPPPVEGEGEGEYDFSVLNELARKAMGVHEASVQAQPQAQPAAQEQAPVQPIQPEKEVPVYRQPSVSPEIQIPHDFITKEDVQKVLDAPDQAEGLHGLMTTVYKQAFVNATKAAMLMLPHVMQPMVVQMSQQIATADNFYKENPDLNKARDFVKYCAMQVEAQHPDWDMKKVLTEAARLTRERAPALLAAQKKAATRAKPSFAQQSGGKGERQKPTGELSALEKELAAMPDSAYFS